MNQSTEQETQSTDLNIKQALEYFATSLDGTFDSMTMFTVLASLLRALAESSQFDFLVSHGVDAGDDEAFEEDGATDEEKADEGAVSGSISKPDTQNDHEAGPSSELERPGAPSEKSEASSGLQAGQTRRTRPVSNVEDGVRQTGDSDETEHLKQRLDALIASIIGAKLTAGTDWGDTFLRIFSNEGADESATSEAETELQPNAKFFLTSGGLIEYRRRTRQNRKLRSAVRVMPRMLVVGMVSQFDVLISELIRALFRAAPELLNSSERTVSVSELMSFSSLDDAREHIVSSTVDDVLRKSHVEQIKWLERKTGLVLVPPPRLWAPFVEVTQRRNLFVHSDGCVSIQYVENCRKAGVADVESRIGTRLDASPEYLVEAYHAIFETGVKLAYVLWKKFFPHQGTEADSYLNNLAVEIVRRGDYELAISLLEFPSVTKQPRLTRTSDSHMFRINIALANKMAGRQERCDRIVTEIEWDCLADRYQLARALLRDDFKDAVHWVRRLGEDPRMELAYRSWPICEGLRRDPGFHQAYKEIFGHDFNLVSMQEVREQLADSEESN
ncbi:MAG: hypothetical protein AAF799_13115 [Myxococcota bacterium]